MVAFHEVRVRTDHRLGENYAKNHPWLSDNMSSYEIFIDKVRRQGDFAGVFEYDGDTGYFYLYETTGQKGRKILDQIHIISGTPDFSEVDLEIRWDRTEKKVGLFILNKLWAVFDINAKAKYGGDYKKNLNSLMPTWIEKDFETDAR